MTSFEVAEDVPDHKHKDKVSPRPEANLNNALDQVEKLIHDESSSTNIQGCDLSDRRFYTWFE